MSSASFLPPEADPPNNYTYTPPTRSAENNPAPYIPKSVDSKNFSEFSNQWKSMRWLPRPRTLWIVFALSIFHLMVAAAIGESSTAFNVIHGVVAIFLFMASFVAALVLTPIFYLKASKFRKEHNFVDLNHLTTVRTIIREHIGFSPLMFIISWFFEPVLNWIENRKLSQQPSSSESVTPDLSGQLANSNYGYKKLEAKLRSDEMDRIIYFEGRLF